MVWPGGWACCNSILLPDRPVDEKGRETLTSPPAQEVGPGTGAHRLGLFIPAVREQEEERPLCCRRCAAGLSEG